MLVIFYVASPMTLADFSICQKNYVISLFNFANSALLVSHRQSRHYAEGFCKDTRCVSVPVHIAQKDPRFLSYIRQR